MSDAVALSEPVADAVWLLLAVALEDAVKEDVPVPVVLRVEVEERVADDDGEAPVLSDAVELAVEELVWVIVDEPVALPEGVPLPLAEPVVVVDGDAPTLRDEVALAVTVGVCDVEAVFEAERVAVGVVE